MIDYQLGKIYKIICNVTGKQYIGSTCELTIEKRLRTHKNDYKRYVNGKHKYTTSFEIIENENYKIVLVENYPCNNKCELHARERFYIENTNCVNKIIPCRKHTEWYEHNRNRIQEQHHKYWNSNKSRLNEIQRQYYEANKELIREKHRQYYQENKERIEEQRRQKRLINNNVPK
jgi:arsenate reductase-like glutaredoxin family protein